MPSRRAAAAAAPGDPGLFALPAAAAPAPRRPGRHERAILRTLREPAGPLAQRRYAAARTTLRALAAAMDAAEAKGDPYAVSQLARPLRDLLADCSLLPDPAGGEDEGALLAALGAPTLGD